ncbi:MHS family proline/betaine transporter-like MFS transporter [Amycolatopsis endophytica]|uniref:Putative proline/betaine transporter n=1 Tax=Amycolatopsis endophytica TaxID=860233 RepID=A0A853B146_9PSEU|nr:MFS transporter [Amycolatopsis endophytica]NYI88803.1 MHS family proline/betaine transporter-like MFS transporter [Amycolatopsis endophytica]
MPGPTEPQRENVSVADPKVVKRAVGAAAIGNITEWYDFGVYGYLTTTISQVFFTELSGPVATIATFGLFAVSFLIRPFGGLLFGPLSDRIGRKRVLSLTVILMALGTFAIGVIPSYSAIGIAAPLLVLLARLVQGVSTGGEYGSAMTFIAEYAPDRRRGFLGSWLEFGTLTGYAFGATIATVLTAVLSEDQLLSWGWRIPFLIALPIGLVGLYLRLRLEETPAFSNFVTAEGKQRKSAGQEFRTIFVRYWPAMLLCAGLVLAWNVTNYMLTSYMPTYLTDTLPGHGDDGVGETAAQVLQIVVLVLLMFVVTFLGRLSDRFGRRRIVLVGCVGLIVLSLPAVLLLRAGGDVATFAGLALMGLTLVCFSSTLPSTLPAMFPTHIRAGALSIAFNVSVSLFGGTTSTVMGALVAATGDLNWPAYYLIAAGIVGAVCIHFTRESAGRPLQGSPAIVSPDEPAASRR